MAIQVQTLGVNHLQLPAALTKGISWASARSGGVLNGLIVGYWQGFFVRIPTNTAGLAFFLAGWDGGNNGNFTAGNDIYDAFGGNNASLGARQNRPQWRARANGTAEAFGGTGGAEMLGSIVLDQTPPTTAALVLKGVSWLEHLGTPGWYGWIAVCRLDTGAVTSYVAPTPVSSTWISSTSAGLAHQIFAARGSGGARTPVGTQIEQFAIAQGDFPWDTANDGNGAVGTGRPHHDAIRALAGWGGNPFLTYSSLAAAQAAGTLPYPNCVQGRSDVTHQWSLRDLATGLTNSGSAGTVTLTIADPNSTGLSNGLADGADFAPAHWYGGAPLIVAPQIRFTPGRGARATVISGSRASGQTVQRRWVYDAGHPSAGSVVPGFDWAATSTPSSLTWSVSDLLPAGGPYALQVRDASTPALASSLTDWLVGTAVLPHGQSGQELGFYNGNPPGLNNLGLQVAAGAQGIFLKLSNQTGGTAATYAPPTPNVVRLIGGQTPACGSGAVACMNEWHAANPGHPLLIAPLAIDGTTMADWAADAAAYSGDGPGHASWRFMGTIGALPGGAGTSGNNSGVVEYHAALLGRFADAHLLMWNPNISTDGGVRAAYVAAVDARFSNSPAAPWVILPPWRAHREPADRAGSMQLRQDHLNMLAELGARGILGPNWLDIVNDDNRSGHSAFNSAPGVPSAVKPVSDGNRVGQSRVGFGYGRVAAWVWNRSIKAHGPRVLAAWFTDAGRASIQVELGRQVRTLGGAAVANLFWISTDNGANFAQTGFSVALSTDGTRAVLTSTGAAFPASNVRVDYGRAYPANPDTNTDEALSERLLDGLLYDDQQHRGGTNFAAGSRAGNPLQGTNRMGAGVAGVAVQARGAPRLVASEPMTAPRAITVRLMAADGLTVLAQKIVNVPAQ